MPYSTLPDGTKRWRRSSPIRRGAGLRKAGRKTKAWEKVRRQLKVEFAAFNIVSCELRLPGCMVDDGLGFAHALKRRHIATDEDMRRVALLCNKCHDVLELQGEAKMSRVIDSLIAKRAA